MKKVNIFILAFLLNLPYLSYANDLLTTYQQALSHDPTYLQTKSRDLGNQVLPDIVHAELLPNISLIGNITTNKQFHQGGFHHGNGYSINLSQTVFDFSKWSSWKENKATAKQAILNTAAALQDLMVRTTSAYFNVAETQEILVISREERANTLRLLKLTRQRYKSGALTATDVANFEADNATELNQIIANETTLAQKRAQLQAMTFQPSVPKFPQLKNTIPLKQPNPKNQAAWLKQTREKNLNIQAQRYAVMAAKQDIKTQKAGHYPTLNIVSSYGDTRSAFDNVGDVRNRNFSATLNLKLPIYQGGSVIANTKKSAYDYQAALQNLSLTMARFIDQSRESFIGVTNGIRQIKALKQSVYANAKAFKDTLYLYNAGQRQSQDVIRAQNSLYAAKSNLVRVKYNYVLNTLKLKQAAGILTINDLRAINNWLK